MKTLYLSRAQAMSLGEDLLEYSKFRDSSDRELFKGFEVKFGDTLSKDVDDAQSLEMTGISNHTEIEGEVD